MLRGKWPMVIAGVVLFGNAMGLQAATSNARRHGRFDAGDVVGWLMTSVVLGGIWGWFMHLAIRQNSLLWDEPADRQAAVNHALETGQLDEDPELRALEFRVAAQRYRGHRFMLCWVAVVLLICLGGYWWLGFASIDSAPPGYREFLVFAIGLVALSGVIIGVCTWRRDSSLERILARREEPVRE